MHTSLADVAADREKLDGLPLTDLWRLLAQAMDLQTDIALMMVPTVGAWLADQDRAAGKPLTPEAAIAIVASEAHGPLAQLFRMSLP